MRRILISEEQEKIIAEALQEENVMSTLPVHLLNDINDDGTSLSMCQILDSSLGKRNFKKMVFERFSEVIGEFNDDVTQIDPNKVLDKVNKTLEICIMKERAIRPQLEQICVNVLSDLFEFPEDEFELSCDLKDEINPNKNINVMPEPVNIFSVMDNPNYNEYQKRRILVSLCVGGAKRIADKAKKIYLPAIFELDEELPHLYSRFEKLNELYLFLATVKLTDKQHGQIGFVNVELQGENKLAQVDAQALIFPVLLNQCIQGLLELFISFGLPDDENLAEEIIRVTDAIEFNPWDMRIGPALFDRYFDTIDNGLDSEDIPYLLPAIAELDTEAFISLFNKVIVNNEEVSYIVNKLYQKSLHDRDYNDFTGRISSKWGEEEIITDDIEY